MPVVIPRSLDDAVEVFRTHSDAVALAGGTDLMVEVNERHRSVEDDTVVALDRVPELRTWTLDRDTARLTIGAAVTWAEIERQPLCDLVPALAEAARTVGSPQIRSAGTVGGNLATCSPAGDGLPVLSALDAAVHLVGPDGHRDLPVDEFMTGVKRTALRPGELIGSVTVPVLDGYQGYSKIGVRNAMVIATASVCVAVDPDVRSVRIALGSVAPTIVRADAAERLVAGAIDWDAAALDDDTINVAAELARDASAPITDHRSTAEYRRHAVGVMTARQLRRAFPFGAGNHR